MVGLHERGCMEASDLALLVQAANILDSTAARSLTTRSGEEQQDTGMSSRLHAIWFIFKFEVGRFNNIPAQWIAQSISTLSSKKLEIRKNVHRHLYGQQGVV